MIGRGTTQRVPSCKAAAAATTTTSTSWARIILADYEEIVANNHSTNCALFLLLDMAQQQRHRHGVL